MKNFRSIILAMLCIAFASCEKQQDNVLDNKIQTEKTSTEYEYSKVIRKMNLTPDMCKEIHNYVNQSIAFGLDEEVRFIEVLNTNETSKVLTRTNDEPSSFSESFMLATAKTRSNANSENFIDLENSEVQIYWPYSEYWDGVTPPTITYAPEDINQDWNYGYITRTNEDGSTYEEQVIVNDAYALENPVWIINSNETPYNELPCFTNGENSKNSIMFANGNPQENTEESKENTSFVSVTPHLPYPTNCVYSVYLESLSCTKQYDNIFRGGPEFIIQLGQSDDYVIDEHNLTSLNMAVSLVRVNLTRSEVNVGAPKYVYAIINSDWLPEENDAAFMIHEKDPYGKQTNWVASLSITWEGKVYGASVSIPYGTKDTMIYKNRYTRDFIFSTNNINKTHGSGDVLWTLNVKQGEVII